MLCPDILQIFSPQLLCITFIILFPEFGKESTILLRWFQLMLRFPCTFREGSSSELRSTTTTWAFLFSLFSLFSGIGQECVHACRLSLMFPSLAIGSTLLEVPRHARD